jgi:hypothetical protein
LTEGKPIDEGMTFYYSIPKIIAILSRGRINEENW